MNHWRPMATAPRDGTFIRLLTKDAVEVVAFYHRSFAGWKDWQSRDRAVYQNEQCHGWHPVNQDAARALPLYQSWQTSRAKERRQLRLP